MPKRRRRYTFPRPQGSTTLRGYGSTIKPSANAGSRSGGTSCVRWGFPIVPGTAFHLDHRDDKRGYLGVSHARCNLRAARKRGNALMRAKKASNPPPSSGRVASRDW